MTVKILVRGGTSRTLSGLRDLTAANLYRDLDRFGKRGVEALRAATPVATSETANSWTYTIDISGGAAAIRWENTHMDDRGQTPVVILLEYGHGTGTGGYVQGRPFIDQAIQPIMDEIADDMWKKVTRGR